MAQEPSGAGRHRQEWERAMAALDATEPTPNQPQEHRPQLTELPP